MALRVSTSIGTSDTSVKSGSGTLHWIIASAAGTGGAFQINDSTDDGGTDKVHGVVGANTGPHFMDFSNAGIEFNSGIYADIPGTNVTLTIGYT